MKILIIIIVCNDEPSINNNTLGALYFYHPHIHCNNSRHQKYRRPPETQSRLHKFVLKIHRKSMHIQHSRYGINWNGWHWWEWTAFVKALKSGTAKTYLNSLQSTPDMPKILQLQSSCSIILNKVRLKSSFKFREADIKMEWVKKNNKLIKQTKIIQL